MALSPKIWIKTVVRLLLFLVMVPIVYIIVSLLLSCISVNKNSESRQTEHQIFLSTNGVHLDIILPQHLASPQLLHGLNATSAKYLAFGWGDEDFYLNTPEWSDLTLATALKALFLESPTLIHLTRYNNSGSNWVVVEVNQKQLTKLNAYLLKSFFLDNNCNKIPISAKGYAQNDDFYRANENYNCFKTCNTWVNNAFKESELKACLWTPFDFGLLWKYD